MELATAYLAKYPSVSFTLRNLGQRLEQFLREEPHWIAPHRGAGARHGAIRMGAGGGLRRRSPTGNHDRRHSRHAAAPNCALDCSLYLSLLELNYAVDKFFLAVQKREADVLRDEASNTFEAMPSSVAAEKSQCVCRNASTPSRRPPLRQLLYYKRLEPEAFAILQALRRGTTVEKACVDAIALARKRLDGPVHQRVVQRLVVARLVLPIQIKMITLAKNFIVG